MNKIIIERDISENFPMFIKIFISKRQILKNANFVKN